MGLKVHLDYNAAQAFAFQTIEHAEEVGGTGAEKLDLATDKFVLGLDALVTWEGPGAGIAEALDGSIVVRMIARALARVFVQAAFDISERIDSNLVDPTDAV